MATIMELISLLVMLLLAGLLVRLPLEAISGETVASSLISGMFSQD